MKKQTLWLLLTGSLCMGFTLLTGPFMKVSLDLSDFLKGFGTSLVFGAFIVQVKLAKKMRTVKAGNKN
jgi:hypothetical protein